MCELFFGRETEDESRHRFGVNRLRLNAAGSTLYTAGRDGVVRQWALEVRVVAGAGLRLRVGWAGLGVDRTPAPSAASA